MTSSPGNPAPCSELVHLICNAHIDPVWQWDWEEGASSAVATFRSAVRLCHEFEGLVFCHNEAVLYEWVEEYDPDLFAEIVALVRQSRWHIMGGWYLQPDCNMPSGEAFVRQVLTGRAYFRSRFGVEPSTAVNFDPFGHSRGLVQILTKSGYDSYLFCRPGQQDCPLPADVFTWRGYDGSEITACRPGFYNSPLGGARAKVEAYLADHPRESPGIVLWGVGNHGGGPSRKDVHDLNVLAGSSADARIVHSTPESFFADARRALPDLPVHAGDLNAWAVGCYTSMSAIKRGYRRLESALLSAEKMAAAAAMEGLMEWPESELSDAWRALLFCQFHDALPGSSVQSVEDGLLARIGHGLHLARTVRARAFFAYVAREPQAEPEVTPVFVYNPHPFRLATDVACEFQLPDQNWSDTFTAIDVTCQGRGVPAQVEKEEGNVNLDWRKRVVIQADLEPFTLTRFDCRMRTLERRPSLPVQENNAHIDICTESLQVQIDGSSGLIDRFVAGDRSILAAGACRLLVMRDNEDPWGMLVDRFADVEGAFEPMDPVEAGRFCGLRERELPPVRVIESGAVRTVVEALLKYANSTAVVRYSIPNRGTEIEVSLRVHWAQADRMLKLEIPLRCARVDVTAQVAFGAQRLHADGREEIWQKWVLVADPDSHAALTIANDGVYGLDATAERLRVSLLRSAAYAGHPIGDRPVVPQDRHTPRIDQGERCFVFRLNVGDARERLDRIDAEALALNEPPYALACFPQGKSAVEYHGFAIDDPAVQLAALKQADDGSGYVIRLFETTGQNRRIRLSRQATQDVYDCEIGAFELRSLLYRPDRHTYAEVDLKEAAV